MNQFTNKNNSSRGKTPANFVTNYMARNDATLTVYPVTNKDNQQIWADNQNNVYNQQRDVLLNRRVNFDKNRPTDQSWFNLTTLEGRAFSQDDLSLSRDKIHEQADNLQQAFDDGHTVLKMVASFDNQYLQDLGVEKENAKNFHEDVDESKLRLAVKKGCADLADSLGYTDPLYIGSIQLDRDHPHAHIAMAETAPREYSHAKFYPDGTENGRINNKNKDAMRGAIDDELERTKYMVFFPSNQIEEAQKANEKYADDYAILPEQKKLMLYSSLDDKNPAKSRMKDDLLNDLMPFTSLSKPQLRRKLDHKAKEDKDKKQDKSKDKKQVLPEILALQTQPLYKLRKTKGKNAKRLAKLKKIKEREKKAMQREERMAQAYNYFERYQQNHPEARDLIQQNILPYYDAALINSSVELDKARLSRFTPVKTVPKQSIKQRNSFIDLKRAAQTPFEKDTLKEHLLNASVSWHRDNYINSRDITQHLRSDPTYVPHLSSLALGNLSLKDSQFQNSQTLSDYENSLVDNAYQAVKQLPQDSDLKAVTSDLVSAHMQKRVQKRAEMQQTAHQAQVRQTPKTEEPKKTKSITYHQADDMLFDLIN